MNTKTDDKLLCSICGQGRVTAHVDAVESEYKGVKALVPLHYTVCDSCHSEFAGQEETLLNKEAVLAFRARVDSAPAVGRTTTSPQRQ
jgi:HTH-type transcriptional regulator/antitoxin MqsA